MATIGPATVTPFTSRRILGKLLLLQPFLLIELSPPLKFLRLQSSSPLSTKNSGVKKGDDRGRGKSTKCQTGRKGRREEGKESEGQAVRRRKKIRQIVLRYQPRILAVGQATPTISTLACSSTAEIPGSSLSYPSVCSIQCV